MHKIFALGIQLPLSHAAPGHLSSGTSRLHSGFLAHAHVPGLSSARTSLNRVMAMAKVILIIAPLTATREPPGTSLGCILRTLTQTSYQTYTDPTVPYQDYLKSSSHNIPYALLWGLLWGKRGPRHFAVLPRGGDPGCGLCLEPQGAGLWGRRMRGLGATSYIRLQ